MVMPTIRYTISQEHCSLTLLKKVSQFVQTQQYMSYRPLQSIKKVFSCLNFYFINCYFHYERFPLFLRGSYTATATRESAQP